MPPPAETSPMEVPPVNLAEGALIPLLKDYHPHQAFVIGPQGVITQEQFLQDLAALAAQLPKVKFALNVCEDRYYFLLAFCAALVNQTINLLPPTRQRNILNDIASDYSDCYCLTDSVIESDLPVVNLRTLLEQQHTLQPAVLPNFSAQQLAAIAFTSGSTGTPTANKKYWGTLVGTARLLAARLTDHLLRPTLVATVPSQHMYGLEMTVMMALQGNCSIHSAKPFFPADIQNVLAQSPTPIVLVSSPVHLRAMVNAGLPMPSLAGVVSATAPLDSILARAAEKCFATDLWEIYGCTEAGSMATRRSTQTSAWTLLNGFELNEFDTTFSATAPHLNEQAPIQDQLQQLNDKEFLLLGRHVDMLNVAGKRASLADLTLKLLRIDGVDDGVIFLLDANQQGERPVALVVSELSEKVILQKLAQCIDVTFLPRPLRKIAQLPRNETGKLTRAALLAAWYQEHAI